jgi:hypothetical protein
MLFRNKQIDADNVATISGMSENGPNGKVFCCGMFFFSHSDAEDWRENLLDKHDWVIVSVTIS